MSGSFWEPQREHRDARRRQPLMKSPFTVIEAGGLHRVLQTRRRARLPSGGSQVGGEEHRARNRHAHIDDAVALAFGFVRMVAMRRSEKP
jgi:hypothetical protein